MAGIATLYLLSDDPSPVLSGVLGVGFLVGVLVAVGSPTRWSVSTTVRLYQAVPLLFGVTAIGAGGYYLSATGLWVSAAVLVCWGALAVAGVALADWGAVEAYLEDLSTSGAATGDAWPPLPRWQFLRLRYAGLGVLTAGAAAILGSLLYRPDVGVVAALAGVGGAGLLTVWCSPYSGSPERVVRVRRARWLVLAVGLGASSLYGFLMGNVAVLAAVLGAVAVGVGYWTVAAVAWDEVGESIAAEQAESADPGR